VTRRRRDWTAAIPADVLAASGLTRAELRGAEPAGARQHAAERPKAREVGAEGAQECANRAPDAAAPVLRSHRGTLRDVSDDEWCGTGPKGRYPVGLQYRLWLAGWLAGQETERMVWVARHADGRVVSAATARELVEVLL